MTVRKWEIPLDRGQPLTTGLNSLADATISAAGTAIDNGTNLDSFIILELLLATLNPTGSPYVGIYITYNIDGTYEDAPVTSGVNQDKLLTTLKVTTGSGAKRVRSRKLEILPFPFKLYLDNQVNVALASSGNILTAYTTNPELS